MQRLHKSPQAGLGLTFFTFLALAIIPFSLRAAGVRVSISPRLSAAIDVWRQISDGLGSGYQSGAESVSEPVSAQSQSTCPHRQLACASRFAETLTYDYGLERPTEAIALNARVESHPQKTLRRPHQVIASHGTGSRRIQPVLATDTVTASFELEAALSDLKLEKLPRQRISWQSVRRDELLRGSAPPQAFKTLVRIMYASPSINKPVSCKERSAIEGPRETAAPPMEPDNSDL